MTTQIATGLLLLVLPVAYNVLFTVLARTFDYPDILRQPTNDILRRFTEGGSSLVLTWWGFAMTAVLLAPAVVLLSNTVTDANATVVALATTFGVLAAAVQFLGLIRWPLAVPYLARAATDPSADRATEAAVEVTFQTLNRYLGVAVGEHLGYLFTGLWTAFAGIALVQSDPPQPRVRCRRDRHRAALRARRRRVRRPVRIRGLEGQRRARPDRLRRLVDLAAHRRHRPLVAA